MPDALWHEAPLVAIDLEGTGAQDHEREAILEIALVPLQDGAPHLSDAYTTLINPQRPVPRRPWISPGLTDAVLATAPPLDQVAPTLSTRLHHRILLGHNIDIDWRLLHRTCPDVQPAGLIDTLRLARHLHPTERRHGLTALLNRYGLTTRTSALVPDGQPHRALWDGVGTALLLPAIIRHLPNDESGVLSLTELRRLAERPLHRPTAASPTSQAPPHPEQLPLL